MPYSSIASSMNIRATNDSDRLLGVIFEYMTKITVETDIKKMVMNLADLGKELVYADRCSVWLHNPEERSLWTVGGHGVQKISIPEDSGFAGHTVQTGAELNIQDAYKDERFNPTVDKETGYRTVSVLCIPFHNAEGKIIGAFQAINKLGGNKQFTAHDLDVLKIASNFTGKSLEAFILRNELVETQKEIIVTMGEIGESRSQETGFHVKRVAKYSFLLACLLGIPESEALKFKYASPMHDIGKVAIPDSILLKPGKLTEEEFNLMKQHTTIGHNVFKKSNRELLQIAAIIANEHHERWDGKGYPAGKKGEDIHIYGRITAVADVFDALGSDRVYKKAWPLEKITSYMTDERGKQFDPRLVDLFLENLDQFISIRDEFVDGSDE
ncbi:HD domain-containing phosphohydrolase [Sporosarcina sp. PTS2304]|uniref:HD domain-containing phosphohydrolase n=1 Tax=Sporosarcina sp. PTS2304 TaxID=2283194 RepID=UPI001963E647|nr:HD domain-containing phosphohydrolase [Sporosarcina sp. PTS2304]